MGATTLKPGAETSVSLDLIMHPGMEGPHLFQTKIPVTKGDGPSQPVELYVKALFR